MSPLRRWLRAERAAAHKLRTWQFVSAHVLSPGMLRPIAPDRIGMELIREPHADQHVHGRDCDWPTEAWYQAEGRGPRWYREVRQPAACGVEDGEYPGT